MDRISFDDLFDWCELQNDFLKEYTSFDYYEDFEEEGVLFHKGDYVCDELNIAPCVVVEGNLKVNKITWQYDCGLLVVTNDLICKDFSFPYDAVIGKDLHAENIDINSGCDYSLRVGKNIIAHSVIESGHNIEVFGTIKAKKVESKMNRIVVKGSIIKRILG